MEKKPHRISVEEIQFIQDNCIGKMTDAELSRHLKRDIKTIRRIRQKLGIVKDGKNGLSKDLKEKIKNKEKVRKPVLLATQKLTEDDRKAFFEKELKNSLYYTNLKKQFTDDEIEFYLKEWASLCLQFEDILQTEKRQIEELIKSEIIGNRIMSNVKLTEDYITQLQKDIEEFRNRNDLTMEENQKRDEQMMFMIQKMGAISSAMTNDYHKNLDIRNKLFENLNGRRKDRIDQLKKSGVTFAGIVQALRDRETRKIQGRHMELVKLAKEKKQDEFRKPTIFPDGSKSCILLDSESILNKDIEKLILDDNSSLMIEEFKEKHDKNILIIENDPRRIQLFQEVFKNAKLEFASNNSIAIDKIKEQEFDLVCLDYDLNLGEKSDQFVHYILANNLLEGSKFLVHSMNHDGSKLLNDLLIGKRITEVFPFEKIGAKNAT